jgi:inositol oxygenase
MAAAVAMAPVAAQPTVDPAKRDYSSAADRVKQFYTNQHKNQTLEFARAQAENFLRLDKMELSAFEAINMLDDIVDESDPDLGAPQIFHAIQTAETARKQHPEPEYEWYWVAAFIHDMGKVLAHTKFGSQPQWAVVGDSFPVGCAFSDKCVYPTTFAANPDSQHPVYSTPNGIYQPGCGFDKLTMSWGHDEYLYQVLVRNGCTLPAEALYVIRFHSFYPWHSAQAYSHLASDFDRKMLPFIREFQKCDLYSKDNTDLPDLAVHKPMYEKLVAKYVPAKLRF